MSITKSQNAEMDISAFLNQYVYKDDQSIDYDNKSINDIVDMSPKLKNDKVFMNCLEKNPEWGNIVLTNQSSIEGNIPMTELIACTFKEPNTGNVYVSYRGTGDGKWVDNGVAMSNESSLMQRRAEEYFDSVIEDAGNNLMNYQDGKLIVTGHSKGGNSAQYVTLSSKYGHLIDNCYSMDGQGFSPMAIKSFKGKYGEKYYQDQINKMYSINGHNDYVHDLGMVVIKEENTYFFNSTAGDGFAQWHENDGFFNLETGQINFFYDNEGNIVSVEQGPIGEFAKQLSGNMMTLNEEDLEDCTVTIMTLLEKMMGGEGEQNYQFGTGDVKGATGEEIIGFIAVGIPLILKTAATSDEVKKLISDYISGYVSGIWESENGELKVIGGTVALVLLAPLAIKILAPAALGIWFGALVIETLHDIAEKIYEFSKEFAAFCVNMANAIEECVKKISEWYNSNFNSGYKYAIANPYIYVDTYKLEEYAGRLNRIYSRVSKVEDRIDSLYHRVLNIEDLFGTANALLNLLSADILLNYKNRLKQCTQYLNETANLFSNAERDINSRVPGI